MAIISASFEILPEPVGKADSCYQYCLFTVY